MAADQPAISGFGSGVIADSLRELGHLDRTAGPGLLPLDPSWRFAARCRTARWVKTDELDAGNYLELAALIDGCRAGECIVMGAAEGAAPGSVWGELCATAAAARGCAGVVIDGHLRDSLRLLEVGVPTFARGALAQDYQGRARLMELDVEIVCGGVVVRPGDIVTADLDGVVFTPAEIEADVLREAVHKAGQEEAIARALAAGRTLAEAVRATGTL